MEIKVDTNNTIEPIEPPTLNGKETLRLVLTFLPVLTCKKKKRTKKGVVTFEVINEEKLIPSVNEFLNLVKAAAHSRFAMFAATAMVKDWREHGKLVIEKCLESDPELLPNGPLAHCRIVVCYYGADYRHRDIHNLWTKPVIDGFTDSGKLWVDDNIVLEVATRIVDICPNNPRVVFYIYEIELEPESAAKLKNMDSLISLTKTETKLKGKTNKKKTIAKEGLT